MSNIGEIDLSSKVAPFDVGKSVEAIKRLTGATNTAGGETQDGRAKYTQASFAEWFALSDSAKNFTYLTDQGQWLQFDGKVWSEERSLIPVIKRHVAGLILNAPTAKTDLEPDNYITASYRQKIYTSTYLEGIKRLCQSLEPFITSSDQFDKHHNLLNTPDCVLRLDDGSIELHAEGNTRQYLFTKLAPIVPKDDEDGKLCPDWMRLLWFMVSGNSAGEINAELLRKMTDEDGKPNNLQQDNQRLFDFIEARIGADLWGSKVDETCLIFAGEKACGKSRLAAFLLYLFGPYGWRFPKEALLKQRVARASVDIAELAGNRIAVTEELGADDQLDTEKLKSFTGNDLVARLHYQGNKQIIRTFSGYILTNQLPELKQIDEALFRRLRIVPCRYSLPKDRQDHELGYKLQQQAPYILNRLINAGRKYRQGHYKTDEQLPEAVRSVLERYKQTSDRACVEQVIDDYCDKLEDPKLVMYLNDDQKVYMGNFLEVCRMVADRNGEGFKKAAITTDLKQKNLYAGYGKSRDKKGAVVGGLKWKGDQHTKDLKTWEEQKEASAQAEMARYDESAYIPDEPLG